MVSQSDSLFSIIVGPLVWVGHFLVVYLTTAIICAKGLFDLTVLSISIVPLVVGAATLMAASLVIAGTVLAYRRCSRLGWDAPDLSLDRSDTDSRRHFMAYAGLLLGGLSLLAIVWEALPVALIDSCR